MASKIVSLVVNGAEREFIAKPGDSLLSALRDSLGLTAAKRGCAQGGCGTCTVLVDGAAVPSCLVAVETIEGSSVKTLEGVAPGGELDEVQSAFVDDFATQCGFCTAGMILVAEAMLERETEPTEDQVAAAISGNVCRCTGYRSILTAILDAASRRRNGGAGGSGAAGGVLPRPAARPAPIDKTYFAAERDDDYNVIGSVVGRSDARGHVTGGTRFFEDVAVPGLLHLKMHRSARHHARIRGLHLTDALAVPGVVRILTHADIPNNLFTPLKLIGVGPDDEPILAEDTVRYVGEPICAVVAETEAAAHEAVARVRVDYEDLPAVFDVEEALAEGAPLVNEYHGHNYFTYEGHHCRRIRFGDVDEAFAAADHVFEWRYDSAPIEHAPTETTGCIVVPQSDGRLRIHSNTQACFFTLDNTALILGTPFNKLRIVGGTVGGGFGGKVDVAVEPVACVAAMTTNRPVKYVFSRQEEMQVSSPRAAERFYIKDGVLTDGRIIGRKITLFVDAGAYARHSPYGTTKAAAHMPGPYSIPNVWVDAHCVFTNRTPSSAMRGFGVTIGDFALESQMDRIARELNMDPLRLRLRNAYRDGDMKAHRKIAEGTALVEVIQKAAELAGHELPEPFRSMSSMEKDGR